MPARARIYLGTSPLITTREAPAHRNTVIAALDAANVEGAPIYESEGIWEGEREPSFTVELIGERLDVTARAGQVADYYREHAGQDAVLVTVETLDVAELRTAEPSPERFACPNCGADDEFATVEKVEARAQLIDGRVNVEPSGRFSFDFEGSTDYGSGSQTLGIECGACGWQKLDD